MNKSIIKAGASSSSKQSYPLIRIIVCAAMSALYLCLLLSLGLGYYADSAQYVEMHFRRDPLYPIYLWMFRTLLGKDTLYLYAAAIVQLLLNYVCISLVMPCE